MLDFGGSESLPPYAQPFAAGDLQADYNKHGFLSFPAPVEQDLLDRVAIAMKGMPPGRQADAWRRSEPIRSLAIHPGILELLRTLYKREPIPFQTLNFSNSPQQPIHTDMLHFSAFPSWYMCGVWIALEPVDATNGPLCYYPGSHNEQFHTLADLGISVEMEPEGYQRNQLRYSAWLVSHLQSRGLREHWFTCGQGQVMLWASNLAHGSIKVTDPSRTRFSQVTHYFFEDCMYYVPAYSDLPVGRIHYKEVTNIISGSKVPHRYFGRQELDGQAIGPQFTQTQLDAMK